MMKTTVPGAGPSVEVSLKNQESNHARQDFTDAGKDKRFPSLGGCHAICVRGNLFNGAYVPKRLDTSAGKDRPFNK